MTYSLTIEAKKELLKLNNISQYMTQDIKDCSDVEFFKFIQEELDPEFDGMAGGQYAGEVHGY